MTDDVRKKTPEQLTEAQGTPGIDRRTAFEGDGHWFGHVVAAAETMSGWHHHGENTTVGYILKGRVRLEYGRRARSAPRRAPASTSSCRPVGPQPW